MRSPGFPLSLAVALGCWPVLAWYGRSMADASNDPWGGLALLTALLVVVRAEPVQPARQPLLLPGAIMLLYVLATLAGLPIALCAVLAVSALAALCSAQKLGHRLDLPLLALLWLALPLSASLQFYGGYPLRLLAGWLAVGLLKANGLAVGLDGAVFLWDGRQIAIDAPCSGLRMLWAGGYLTAAAAALFRFSPRQTALAAVLSGLVVLAANAVRAAALFYLESGLLPLPAWTHEAAGMSVFIAAGLVIVRGVFLIHRARAVTA